MTSPQHLTGLFRALTRINLHHLEQRTLTHAHRIHKAGRNTPDGYPRSTLGDGTSRGTAELTSTEAAANARIEGTTRDPQQDNLDQLAGFLEQALFMLGRADTRCTNLDQLIDPEPRTNDPTCASCTDRTEHTLHNPGERLVFGTVGGVFSSKRHICDTCYRYIERDTIRRYPTAEEIANKARYGRWKHRATAE